MKKVSLRFTLPLRPSGGVRVAALAGEAGAGR